VAENIQEFLATLGFKIDESGLEKFENSLKRLGSDAIKLGAAALAGVTAVTAAITKMASSFENLFYLSQRTRTSVEDIKALQYAFGQVGLTASDASSAITGIAMALRSNPGYGGLLKAWGINPAEGADKILADLIHKLSTMAPYVAQQYAAMFGISPQLLLQLEQNLPRLEESQRRYNEEAKRAGVNQGLFSWQSVQFMNTLRDLGATVELIWMSLASQSLPHVTEALKSVNTFLESHFADIREFGRSIGTWLNNEVADFKRMLPVIDQVATEFGGWKIVLNAIGDIVMYRIFGPIGLAIALMEQLKAAFPEDWKKGVTSPAPVTPGHNRFNDPANDEGWNRLHGWEDQVWHWLTTPFRGGSSPEDPSGIPSTDPRFAPTPKPQNQSYEVAPGGNRFKAIEAAFSLPDGLLDRVWATESNRGRNTRSPAGALGDFQFMPATAQQYGLKDPFNLQQSANAAGHYLADLVHKFGGSVAKALAAYNWGSGNLDKDIRMFGENWRQHLPGETSRYLDRILGGTAFGTPLGGAVGGGRGSTVIHQQTHITVPGAHDPVKTATEVAMQQRRVNGDLVRNFSGAVIA
jgi:hypothetical protein